MVKILGGAYLIWLGIKCWRAKAEVTEVSAVRRASAFRDYLGGVFLTLGNPKVILFYIGFLPTFMDLGALSPADIAIACAVVSGALGTTMVAYAYLASRARRLLKSERGVRVLNRGSGTVLIGAGAVVATA